MLSNIRSSAAPRTHCLPMICKNLSPVHCRALACPLPPVARPHALLPARNAWERQSPDWPLPPMAGRHAWPPSSNAWERRSPDRHLPPERVVTRRLCQATPGSAKPQLGLFRPWRVATRRLCQATPGNASLQIGLFRPWRVATRRPRHATPGNANLQIGIFRLCGSPRVACTDGVPPGSAKPQLGIFRPWRVARRRLCQATPGDVAPGNATGETIRPGLLYRLAHGAADCDPLAFAGLLRGRCTAIVARAMEAVRYSEGVRIAAMALRLCQSVRAGAERTCDPPNTRTFPGRANDSGHIVDRSVLHGFR